MVRVMHTVEAIIGTYLNWTILSYLIK